MPDDLATLQATLAALAPHYSQRRLAALLEVDVVTLRRWRQGRVQTSYLMRQVLPQAQALLTRCDMATPLGEPSP